MSPLARIADLEEEILDLRERYSRVSESADALVDALSGMLHDEPGARMRAETLLDLECGGRHGWRRDDRVAS